jgi:eukaryotic-like serine/threonine-protein kinase
MPEPSAGQTVGRYVLYDEIASGGMASVHMGRLIGPAGFSRVVAAKRLHAAYAKDPDFVMMLLDEARVASRVRHPNVVPILDVVAAEGELLLVMEYVPGETLARLLRASRRAGSMPPPEIVSSIMIDVLRGLHAAHEAQGADGAPLRIIHRDVSPQNVLVSTDGSARLLDFGVAKAASRAQTTDEGQLKGKLGYIAPEQLSGAEVDRRADIFAASIVAWEAIAASRLFVADDPASTLARVASAEIPSLRAIGCDISEALERVVARGLERDPEKRYATAEAMARDFEEALRPASRERVTSWLEQLAGDVLAARQKTMRRIETESSELGAVEVPVELPSAGQSGSFVSFRKTLAPADTREPRSFDDAGSLVSPLATHSITPPVGRRFGMRSVLLLAAATLAVAVVVAASMLKRSSPPVELPAAAAPSAPADLAAATRAAASAAASSAPAEDVPAPAAASSAPVEGVPAPSLPKPPPGAAARARPAKSAASQAATEPVPAPAKPAPTPVDPLADQR